MTNKLARRIYEHKNKFIKGFTYKYNVNKLVYYEQTNYVNRAIEREKQIKGWVRKKKIELIESVNKEWKDLGLELNLLPEESNNEMLHFVQHDKEGSA